MHPLCSIDPCFFALYSFCSSLLEKSDETALTTHFGDFFPVLPRSYKDREESQEGAILLGCKEGYKSTDLSVRNLGCHTSLADSLTSECNVNPR